MGNEFANILSFNNFFEKSNIFGDNGEKILGGHDHFLGADYNLFYRKLNAKNFNNFFEKSSIF